MDARWRIELLGQLRATREDHVVDRFPTRYTGLLLAYLACHLQRPSHRDVLTETIWPDADLQSGRHRLSVALTYLRRELEVFAPTVGPVIQADRATVRLNPAAVVTDLAEFDHALGAAAATPVRSEQIERLSHAVELFRGEFLRGYSDDWVLEQCRSVTECYFRALGQLLLLLEEAGDVQHALEYARRGAEVDPLREEAQRDLIRLLGLAGQPESAVRQHRELERRLQEELGVEPTAATRALVQAIEKQAAESPLRPPDRPGFLLPSGHLQRAQVSGTEGGDEWSGHLPAPLARFFGREEETARLFRLLCSPDTRLVTLTGPFGTGKTRLALEAARHFVDAKQGPLWWVSLLELTDARRIPEAIHMAMGLPRLPGVEPLTHVIDALSRQASVLVLDNLEHLIAEGAVLVRRLLNRLPGLTCLITSRRRLELTGERVVPVDPLPVPAGDPGDQTPDTVLRYSSVQLFVDRAQGVNPEFRVSGANAAAVAALCVRLEGLPLALELAAARAGVMTPDQMFSQLNRRFGLLVSRGSEADTRHASLRTAIDWSYRLLSMELQQMFTELSVFQGGWTGSAAEAICGPWATRGVGHAPALSVLDALSQLQSSSLIQAEENSGEIRFRMLESLREYGAEQQSSEQRLAHRRRHAAYYLALVEEAAEELKVRGERRRMWVERLEAERENLRAALRWSLEDPLDPECEVGLRFVGGLLWFWYTHSDWREGQGWASRVLARNVQGSAPGSPRRTRWRASALLAAGVLAEIQKQCELARSLLEESLSIWRELDDGYGIASCLSYLGWVTLEQRGPAEARSIFEQSVAISRERCPGVERSAVIALGHTLRQLGDREGARVLYEEALRLGQQLGDLWPQAAAANGLAAIAMECGDWETARAQYEATIELRRASGIRALIPTATCELGRIAVLQGRWNQAEACFCEFLAMSRLCPGPAFLEGMVELADVEVKRGEAVRAARLLGAGASLRPALAVTASTGALNELEASVAASASAALGDDVYAVAWKSGLGMSVNEVVALVSGESAATGP